MIHSKVKMLKKKFLLLYYHHISLSIKSSKKNRLCRRFHHQKKLLKKSWWFSFLKNSKFDDFSVYRSAEVTEPQNQLVFYGLNLNQKLLVDWIKKCGRQKKSKKSYKTLSTLTSSELQKIQVD